MDSSSVSQPPVSDRPARRWWQATEPQAAPGEGGPMTRRASLLVVDDIEANRNVLSRRLTSYPFDVSRRDSTLRLASMSSTTSSEARRVIGPPSPGAACGSVACHQRRAGRSLTGGWDTLLESIAAAG